MNAIDFTVSVRCMTYNQSAYIEDALNGFTMQQTDFPFLCVVMDDASIDGEQEIISRYLEKHFDLSDKSVVMNEETDDYVMTFAQHKENKNCYFAAYYLKYNHYSIKRSKILYCAELEKDVKYIAICEGDDYWIDPHKLMKQVQILEDHSSLFMCGSNGLVLWEGATHNPVYFNDILISTKLEVEYVIKKWAIPTASILVRSDIFKDYPEWTKKIYSGDMTLILLCAHKGNGIYSLGDVTCVYRRDEIASASVSMTTNKIKAWNHMLILYDEFDKYTNGMYKDTIACCQKELRKLIKFHELLDNFIILPFLFMPIYTFNKVLKKMRSLLFGKIVKMHYCDLTFFVKQF